MIFHSRVSENKVQSFITIAFYKRVYYMAVGWVAVLLHWLVLGRETTVIGTDIEREETSTLSGRPAQVASGFG